MEEIGPLGGGGSWDDTDSSREGRPEPGSGVVSLRSYARVRTKDSEEEDFWWLMRLKLRFCSFGTVDCGCLLLWVFFFLWKGRTSDWFHSLGHSLLSQTLGHFIPAIIEQLIWDVVDIMWLPFSLSTAMWKHTHAMQIYHVLSVWAGCTIQEAAFLRLR